jgi:hypothetical protein
LKYKRRSLGHLFKTESIKLSLEDQAFSPTNDLAPRPPLPPPPVSKLDRRNTGRLRKIIKLLTGEGGGDGGGAKSYDGEKVYSSINHSILWCTVNPSVAWRLIEYKHFALPYRIEAFSRIFAQVRPWLTLRGWNKYWVRLNCTQVSYQATQHTEHASSH